MDNHKHVYICFHVNCTQKISEPGKGREASRVQSEPILEVANPIEGNISGTKNSVSCKNRKVIKKCFVSRKNIK